MKIRTPRTDAAAEYGEFGEPLGTVPVDFARALKIENSKLKEKLKKRAQACRELNTAVRIRNSMIEIQILRHREALKRSDDEKDAMRKLFRDSLDWLDDVCYEQSDLRTKAGIEFYQKIERVANGHSAINEIK